MTEVQPPQLVQKVTVTDIDMPFMSMVNFMVKVALAAVPALLILGLLTAILAGLLTAIGLSGLS